MERCFFKLFYPLIKRPIIYRFKKSLIVRTFNFNWLFLFIACSLLACTDTSKTAVEKTTSKLGDIAFDVSGNSVAEPAFEKGLLLLHSFEYEDARAAFLEAQALDSTFAMAYWGEAMS